ncbi:dihydroxyacetone phosphate acyltransferase isoform X1 [Anabrus simplex]|uniref:dihydroxyacetone phosphate acyltransferase isoform X1 n=1 Tax=Anabrus simplex TaxID=316456 RepID=UPI0035A3804F
MDPTLGIRRMEDFQNILKDRCGTSDISFMTKKWDPIKTHTPLHRIDPNRIKHEVFMSDRVQGVLGEVSRDTGKSIPMLCIEIHEMLDEMGYNRRMGVIRWMGFFLIKILKKTCSGVLVNEYSIDRVKGIMGKTPVVFAPSHRSYADFIILSFVCYNYDIEIPVVAAGMDFQQIYIMGRVLRNCCAFYMKRSFGSDKLYWAVFGEYVSMLITNNDAPVEFFIEGTRSRSAKSLTPKLGFLSMVLDPFFCGRIDDVTIVPINISYDRTLEEDLFAYELLGAPKPKESATGLLKALTLLSGLYGRIYVDFSEPISVKQFCGIPKQRLTTEPCTETLFDKSEIEVKVVPSLANTIVQEQQCHAVLTAFNLIAVILNNSLFIKPQKLAFGAFVSEVKWLKDVMERFGALVDFHGNDDVEDVVCDSMTVHKNLVLLSDSHIVTLAHKHASTDEPQYVLAPGHSLSNEIMKVAVPVMMLHHYINPCLSFLITPAVITIVLQSIKNTTPSISKDELFKKYHYVRMLLLQDFVMGKANEAENFNTCLEIMDSLNLLELRRRQVHHGRNIPLQSLLIGLLRPYFFSYLTLCLTLKESKSPRTVTDLTREAQKRVESLLLSSYPVHPYSLALDLFTCAMRSLEFMRAAVKVKREGQLMYQPGPHLNRVTLEIDKYVPRVIDVLISRTSSPSSSSSSTLIAPSSSKSLTETNSSSKL